MPLSSPRSIAAFAALSLCFGGCSADNPVQPTIETPVSGGAILTSFDRLTLSRGERSSFGASLVGSAGRLSSEGLTFIPRAGSVTRISGAHGRVEVRGIAAGRTWIIVQSADAADSVEVIVQ